MNKDIIVVSARLRAKSGKEDELKRVLSETVAACKEHKGLLLYSVQQDREDPASFLFYEHFSSQEAFQSHLDSPELAAAGKVLGELLDGEPEIRTWEMANSIGGFAS